MPRDKQSEKERWPNKTTKRVAAARIAKGKAFYVRDTGRGKKGANVGKNIHVVPSGKGWAVKPEKGGVSSTHRTQQAAIERGRSQAKQNQSELNVHGRDGQIREKNTYGKDPYPPKG